MKRILCITVCLLALSASCFASLPACFKDVDESRLAKIPNYVETGAYYDEEALVRHNKFSPFGDRIIDVWLYICPSIDYHNNVFNKYTNPYHYMWRGLISFNIDKRTMSFLLSTNAKAKNRPIHPNSRWERYLKYFEKVY